MGMFDTYVFATPEKCRRCGTDSVDAQGKDSDCELRIYRQGAAMFNDFWPDEDPSVVAGGASDLPSTFKIYDLCRKCGAWNEWVGRAVDGVWVDHVRNRDEEDRHDEWRKQWK